MILIRAAAVAARASSTFSLWTETLLNSSTTIHKGNFYFSTVNQEIVSITGNFTVGQTGQFVIYLLDTGTSILNSVLATKAFTTVGGEQEVTFDSPVEIEAGQRIMVVAEDTASTGLETYVTSSVETDENGFWVARGRHGTNTDPLPVGYSFSINTTFMYSFDIKSLVVTGSGTGDRAYWRMRATEGQSTLYFVVAEMEMRESIGGANTATSGAYIEGGHHTTADGSLAFDNNPATWWRYAVADGIEDSWIGQDYSSDPVEIKEITIQARTSPNQNQTPREGVIEYSDDGTTWLKAWAFLTGNWGAGGSIQTFPDPNPGTGAPSASEAAYRYWRMLCTDGASAGFFSISQLEFRSTPGGADTANAAQTIFGGTPDLPATNAFNGSDAYSSWVISRDTPADTWLGQDYGVDGDIPVTEVLIRPSAGPNANRAPLTFDMQGSDDGTSWTTVWSGEAAEWTQDPQVITKDGTASGQSASRWRILVTNRPTSGQVGIKELELRTTPGGGQTADLSPVSPNGESTARTITINYPSTGAFGGQFDENGWRSAPMSEGSYTWLEFAFFSPRAIVEVMIETEDDYQPLDFRIQYHDGDDWVDAGLFNISEEDYDAGQYVASLTF